VALDPKDTPIAKTVTVTKRNGKQYHVKREEAARLAREKRAQYLNEDHTLMIESFPAGFDTCWKITPSGGPGGMPVWQFQA